MKTEEVPRSLDLTILLLIGVYNRFGVSGFQPKLLTGLPFGVESVIMGLGFQKLGKNKG